MDTIKLVSLRMYPWKGPALEVGQYLHHDGARAKTAYFVIEAKSPQRWAWNLKCQRLPISEIPEGAQVQLFHWHSRDRKRG